MGLSVGNHLVAVVGAGPAGLFAARQLAGEGIEVVLFNRDVKPGGLAEYGIYYDKYKMKEGLRKQFHQILEHPNIHYYGNVTVGQDADFTLTELRAMGFEAVLVTVGAQGTKWLGLPGEDLRGVYHAKDIVYHYNRLPPFSAQTFYIGKRVALIGAGNVMLDIAHWVVRERKVDEVVAVVRRGPAEVKFTRKELENVARNLDFPALEAEFERVKPFMEKVGQDVGAAKDFILSSLPKALEPVSNTCMYFDFLASPARILGQDGQVTGLQVDEMMLEGNKDEPKARRAGSSRVLDVDTVVFCIGDKVDESVGLPVQWNEFVKNPAPQYPMDGISFEAFDPVSSKGIDGVFVAGWAREASHGLVGVARKDGENGARVVQQYLAQHPDLSDTAKEKTLLQLKQHLHLMPKPIITQAELKRLEEVELSTIQSENLEDFKFSTNEEMFAVMGVTEIFR
jgi:ferredoxin--NADP+ reductase